MLVLIRKDYGDVCSEAGRVIASAIRKNPRIVLGLPTGKTPLGLYEELVRLHEQEALDFSGVITFNLDEYVGLAATHPQSYHFYMHQHFFSRVNIKPENVHIPDGSIASGYERYCALYEHSISEAGGIDLQVLGIGRTGHIGFNEPASSLVSRTRLKTLTAETIEENQKLFGHGGVVPECAITMGIGTILEARRILLLASGRSKALAVSRAIEGPVAASVSASALQLHQRVTMILDEDAAFQLSNREYYRRVEQMTARLSPERLE